jgi:hypothetical protein
MLLPTLFGARIFRPVTFGAGAGLHRDILLY